MKNSSKQAAGRSPRETTIDEMDSWKTDDRELVETVRKLPLEQVRKILSTHAKESGYASIRRKSSPALFYNRLMKLITTDVLPASVLSKC